jgi:mannose-6-phosphate isomerase-like protein (cupin superfamily)
MAPMFLSPGEGKTISFRGVTVICKVDAETTGGIWSLFEHIAEPGAAEAPPHWHANTDETFYVIEGRVRLRAGDRTEMLLPGSCAFVPRGTLHTFTNFGDATARMLVHVSPGGRACTFQEVFDLVSRERLWPPADRGRFLELLARYDTHLPH